MCKIRRPRLALYTMRENNWYTLVKQPANTSQLFSVKCSQLFSFLFYFKYCLFSVVLPSYESCKAPNITYALVKPTEYFAAINVALTICVPSRTYNVFQLSAWRPSTGGKTKNQLHITIREQVSAVIYNETEKSVYQDMCCVYGTVSCKVRLRCPCGTSIKVYYINTVKYPFRKFKDKIHLLSIWWFEMVLSYVKNIARPIISDGRLFKIDYEKKYRVGFEEQKFMFRISFAQILYE